MSLGRELPIIFFIMAGALPIWPCSCVAQKPACAYVGADAIFLGRVSFNNDDRDLVRFEVEEIFKGIPRGTSQVWIDPGSDTCSAEYLLGKRYLIVAQRTAARAPVIYLAGQCSGSRPADSIPRFDQDLAMLRAYRAGQSLPRVFGYVYLWPFSGWPRLNGPPLGNAQVTITMDQTTLRVTTRSDGAFELADAPAGMYTLTAELAPFVTVEPTTIVTVPEVGCGSQNIALRTTSEIEGKVLDYKGRPTARIPVDLRVVDDQSPGYPPTLSTETNREGSFRLVGVPNAAVRLSCGLASPSSGSVPYSVLYYPGFTSASQAEPLRVAIGEKRAGLVMRLPAPRNVAHVEVRVLWPDGRGVANTFVGAMLDGVYTESAKTRAGGRTELACLEGLSYELKAHTILRLGTNEGVYASRTIPLVCGKDMGPFRLTLDHKERY